MAPLVCGLVVISCAEVIGVLLGHFLHEES